MYTHAPIGLVYWHWPARVNRLNYHFIDWVILFSHPNKLQPRDTTDGHRADRGTVLLRQTCSIAIYEDRVEFEFRSRIRSWSHKVENEKEITKNSILTLYIVMFENRKYHIIERQKSFLTQHLIKEYWVYHTQCRF